MAGRKPQRRREFGTVRKLASGRWQARYIGPDGERYTAPETFETRSDAQDWLNLTRADIERNHWRDPDAGAVNFEKYALRWMEERGLAPTTVDRCGGLLRLHILPTFGGTDLDEITPPSVRTWRAERLMLPPSSCRGRTSSPTRRMARARVGFFRPSAAGRLPPWHSHTGCTNWA